MSAHPALTPMTIDFSNEDTNNSTLTDMFETAGQQAPSLIILEDLDRVFGKENTGDNKSRVTFQHLLNCLDGLGSQDGVIVVATANNPKALDPAILKRPGRFDRAVHFPPPTEELRADHLDRLSAGTLGAETIAWAAKRTEGLSFAEVRECYVLAGQLAFARGDEHVVNEDLKAAILHLCGESQTLGDQAYGRAAGFEAISGPQNADGDLVGVGSGDVVNASSRTGDSGDRAQDDSDFFR
jgi:ATP-dependent 26S proteasome regulatory subunit